MQLRPSQTDIFHATGCLVRVLVEENDSLPDTLQNEAIYQTRLSRSEHPEPVEGRSRRLLRQAQDASARLGEKVSSSELAAAPRHYIKPQHTRQSSCIIGCVRIWGRITLIRGVRHPQMQLRSASGDASLLIFPKK